MPDFIRLGTVIVNMATVAYVDLESQRDFDAKRSVRVVFGGSTPEGGVFSVRFYGAEAEALRRYLRGEATIVAEVAEAVDA